MSELELVAVGIAAVLTAAITAVAGAGGGLVLLVVILQFLDPIAAIPAHGLIQLISNSTRAVTLRGDVETRMLRWYLIPLVPATIVGYFLTDAIPRTSGRAVIGVFALMAVWWPAATKWLAPRAGSDRRFMLVGAVAGLANPTIGAPGPLLAPAFRTAAKDHVTFVASFALVQVLNHTVKVIVFVVAGFAWREHLPMIVIAGAGVMVGTRLGTRYLKTLDPKLLGRLFQVAATVGALRLVSSIL